MYHLIKDIPLYQNLYKDSLVSSLSLKSLVFLPELEKQHVIKGFPNNWMNPKLKMAMKENNFEFMHTSGTTSERLTLIRPKHWWAEEEKRLHINLGKLFPEYSEQTSKAILTTAVCSNNTCYRELPSYEKRIVYGILHLNISLDPNFWTKEDIQRIVDEIEKFKPVYFQADPFYLGIFFSLLKKFKINMPTWVPKLLILTYEYVTQYCSKLIKQFWNIPTIILYGLTEVGFIFYKCSHGNIHTFNNCHYILKKIHGTSRIVQHPLVSSFKNEYMPFINYTTGDLFEVDEKDTMCMCGAKTIAKNFLGRQKDLTLSKTNKLVTIGEIDILLGQLENDIFIYVLDFSFKGKIIFKYITCNNSLLSENQKKSIKEVLESFYTETIEFSFEKSIKPAASGKFKLINKGQSCE